MLREARDSFLSEMELQLKCNLKRFWLTLKLESKHRGIPEVISMATDPSGEPADVGSRIQASSPAEIVELFNRYFVSVFTSDPVTCNSADEEYAGPNVDLTLSDLTPTVTQVLYWPSLTRVKLPVLMKSRLGFWRQYMTSLHPYVKSSKSLSEWAPFPWPGNWPTWSLYSRGKIKNL